MSTQSSLIGIAILGAGIFAKEAHLPAIANLRNLTVLRAVYSRSNKSAQELAKEAHTKLGVEVDVYSDDGESLDKLLFRPDIQGIIVALPITTQPEIILKALKAGKHVLSEKPIAASVSEGHKLIASYESGYKMKNLIWRVAENFEAEPGYIAAGKALKAGKIGKVIGFSVAQVHVLDQSSRWYKTPWRTVPDYQGGFVLDGGVHYAALLRTVLPSPLTHLSAYASLSKKYLAPTDSICCLVKTADGVSGTFDHSYAAATASLPKKRNTVIINGTEGWAEIQSVKNDQGANAIRTTIHLAPEKEGQEETEEVIEELGCGVEKEIESFILAVSGQDDGKGLGSPRAALQDVVLIQAALTSQGALLDLSTVA